MVRCANAKCENHENELEEKTESCPLCGTQTEEVASKNNFNLGLIAILAALASVIIFWSSWGATMWAGAALSVASVVMGIISKNKAAVIISILSLLAIAVPLTITLLE